MAAAEAGAREASRQPPTAVREDRGSHGCMACSGSNSVHRASSLDRMLRVVVCRCGNTSQVVVK